MSPRPMLHFQLVDDRDRVLVDEDVWLHEVEEKACAHGELARGLLEQGRVAVLRITDPDGVLSPRVLVCTPEGWRGEVES